MTEPANLAENQAVTRFINMPGVTKPTEELELPPLRCSRCGVTEDDEPDGFLSDVRVMTADGEEGQADVTMLLCGRDLEEVLPVLRGLGFKDHRHGGINFLEDTECPGWEKCPTPNPEDENGDTAPWNGTYVVPGPTS